jgi:DNA-nicking Smr family endonuclease
MARRRTLHPEEHALWQAVASTARPLHGAGSPIPHQPAAVAPPLPKRLDPVVPKPTLPAFRFGEKARTQTTSSPAQSPLHMDAKAFGRMTRGKLAPEARIDLHGLTLSEAHPELISFVLSAHAHGLRLVLVITGKGKAKGDQGPIPERIGALRHQVPHWLRMAPLGPVVLQMTEAHLRHGGAGAFYVYLRRGR